MVFLLAGASALLCWLGYHLERKLTAAHSGYQN